MHYVQLKSIPRFFLASYDKQECRISFIYYVRM